jgi:predicted amidophosphoribosyltransferase
LIAAPPHSLGNPFEKSSWFKNIMNPCPCCSGQLLRHARHSGVYWFCSHCWQEMPDFSSIVTNRPRVQQLERLIDIYTTTSKQKDLAEVEVGSPVS